MSNESTSGGISLFTLLGILFITLKLLHKIDWSWWWVLAPFWLAPIVMFVVLMVVAIIVVFIEDARGRK